MHFAKITWSSGSAEKIYECMRPLDGLSHKLVNQQFSSELLRKRIEVLLAFVERFFEPEHRKEKGTKKRRRRGGRGEHGARQESDGVETRRRKGQ